MCCSLPLRTIWSLTPRPSASSSRLRSAPRRSKTNNNECYDYAYCVNGFGYNCVCPPGVYPNTYWTTPPTFPAISACNFTSSALCNPGDPDCTDGDAYNNCNSGSSCDGGCSSNCGQLPNSPCQDQTQSWPA